MFKGKNKEVNPSLTMQPPQQDEQDMQQLPQIMPPQQYQQPMMQQQQQQQPQVNAEIISTQLMEDDRIVCQVVCKLPLKIGGCNIAQ